MDRSEQNGASPLEDILETAVSLMRQAAAEHDIPISGDSMLPLIRHGDRVRLKYGTDGIERGEVIVFRQGQGLVAHRVLSSAAGDSGLHFLTKGDNVLRADSPVAADDVLGRVLAIKRGARQMSLDTPAWRTASWLTAMVMLLWIRIYGAFGRSGQRPTPARPTRVAALLSHGARALFSWPLRLSQFLVARWETPGS
jgi:signal peptidase I